VFQWFALGAAYLLDRSFKTKGASCEAALVLVDIDRLTMS